MSLLLDALKEAENYSAGVTGTEGSKRRSAPSEPDADAKGPLSLQEDMPRAPSSIRAEVPAARERVAQVTSLHPAPSSARATPSANRRQWLVVVLCVVVASLAGGYFYLTRTMDAAPVEVGDEAASVPALAPTAVVPVAAATEVEQVLPAWAREPRHPRSDAESERNNTHPPIRSDETPAPVLEKAAVVVGRSTQLPLLAAYAALQAGELDRAQSLYQQVLAVEPDQADSHLGLGIIAQSRQDRETAIEHFRSVLVTTPDQPRAWAGLADLSGDGDLAAIESKLRGMLEEHPDGALYFALGNSLARQSRWAEAQEQFFSATASAPDNAEYCFNLAVALDRIGKRDAAATHYRKALNLAEGRPVQFDIASARSRLAALTSGQS